MQKVLIISGAVVLAFGLLWPWLSKLPLGKLPGDIFVQSDKFSFGFPIVTCILISIILTILMNVWK